MCTYLYMISDYTYYLITCFLYLIICLRDLSMSVHTDIIHYFCSLYYIQFMIGCIVILLTFPLLMDIQVISVFHFLVSLGICPSISMEQKQNCWIQVYVLLSLTDLLNCPLKMLYQGTSPITESKSMRVIISLHFWQCWSQ